MPSPFDGQFFPNSNVGGSGYLVYRNGQWRVAATPPTFANTATPGGSPMTNVYPGYTISENGAKITWDGLRWRPSTF
jgi:hypothetical protein